MCGCGRGAEYGVQRMEPRAKRLEGVMPQRAGRGDVPCLPCSRHHHPLLLPPPVLLLPIPPRRYCYANVTGYAFTA